MKIFRILIIIYTLGLLGCDEKEPMDIANITVEEYISLLQSDQYDFTELPPFTDIDIPALLVIRNDTQVISNFPSNSVSSFFMSNCKLGVYALWTIESIRAVSIEDEHLIGRFPSLNPLVRLQNSEEVEFVFDEASHQAVAKAYFDWWEANKDKTFDEFKEMDPLSGTDYLWH